MSRTIGVFDSGVGGLTVLQAIHQACPGHHTIYFGDTARVPYGDKSPQTILKYALDNVEFLLSHQVDLLVVACNTATAYAFESLTDKCSVPVVGVVIPGVLRALSATTNGHIGILGTKATIHSGVYEREIHRIDPEIKVTSQACPLFVPLVEEGWTDHPATRIVIKEYLEPLLYEGVDTLILGCTHYPLLGGAIKEYCGNEVKVIDSAQACAEQVKTLIGEGSLDLHVAKYFVSDDPEKFSFLGKKLLSISIHNPELVSLNPP